MANIGVRSGRSLARFALCWDWNKFHAAFIEYSSLKRDSGIVHWLELHTDRFRVQALVMVRARRENEPLGYLLATIIPSGLRTRRSITHCNG